MEGAAEAPFAAIQELFDSVTPDQAARANDAYNGGGTRMVFKDAYGGGRGGPHVDEKRVIDLSAHRMQQLTRCGGVGVGESYRSLVGMSKWGKAGHNKCYEPFNTPCLKCWLSCRVHNCRGCLVSLCLQT